ncbi:LysM peptidoglycan-binding domain-containing protein [Candidatus Nitrospira nitrosa]|uniref:LysM peptidoglycan-binding domain-containing protein n=1 Tax=Candidatus Nitrospira nitrosa TaxID=1742972 RepID=UPI000A47A32C|nr:LysM peptidoglycan-binding domain-containing protein [Candidatus Nitrospira nitrosa]
MGIGLILLNLVACRSLGAPGLSDLQLTVDVLNVSLKDAQQAMAELRAEVEVRNQELAETQVMRAQLEGRVREAESRLSEARHVIALQREELAESRADRERIARTRAALQSQLKQLRKQLSRIEKQASGSISPAIMDFQEERLLRPVPAGMKEAVTFGDSLEDRRAFPPSDEVMSGVMSVDRGEGLAQSSILVTPSRVMIKSGDTLWSLAQRYRTSVHQLMAVNALSTDYIQAGQSLWLTESVVDGSELKQR